MRAEVLEETIRLEIEQQSERFGVKLRDHKGSWPRLHVWRNGLVFVNKVGLASHDFTNFRFVHVGNLGNGRILGGHKWPDWGWPLRFQHIPSA